MEIDHSKLILTFVTLFPDKSLFESQYKRMTELWGYSILIWSFLWELLQRFLLIATIYFLSPCFSVCLKCFIKE